MASVRLPEGMHDRLREMAASEHRTVSQELRMLVERHVLAGERRAA